MPQFGLFPTDIAEIKRFCPPIPAVQYDGLWHYSIEMLSLAKAEQKNFMVKPNAVRTSTIQTFGSSDTMMVLFEEVNEEIPFSKWC